MQYYNIHPSQQYLQNTWIKNIQKRLPHLPKFPDHLPSRLPWNLNIWKCLIYHIKCSRNLNLSHPLFNKSSIFLLQSTSLILLILSLKILPYPNAQSFFMHISDTIYSSTIYAYKHCQRLCPRNILYLQINDSLKCYLTKSVIKVKYKR